MSIRVPITDDTRSLSGSSSASESIDNDDGCSDWASDFGEALKTKSLFDDNVFATPEECMGHDAEKYGVDIKEIKTKLGLDVYGLMRLVNVIRKEVGRRVSWTGWG
jgi:protein arginine N-methyltransferase 3